MPRCLSRLRPAAVLAALAAAAAGVAPPDPARAADEAAPVRALLVTGGGYHDYANQKDILTKGVSARANVQWSIAYDPDTECRHLNPVYEKTDWAKGFDVVVHDECSADVNDPAVVDRILQPHRDGVPGVVLHCGIHSYRTEGWNAKKKPTPWFEFTGLASTGHGPQAPIAVTYTDPASPVTKGLEDWRTINEELYNNSTGKLLDTARPLARGKQVVKGKGGQERTDDYVVAWTNEYGGKTRVFATTLGHNNKTVADARYLDLVARGLLWAAGKLDDAHLKPAKQVLLDGPAGSGK